jgi:hypothetical protein
LSLDGVTLILFNYISHGKSIFNLLEEKTPDRNIHYISGEIDTSERNDIRTTLNSAARVIKIYFEEMYIIAAESEDVKLTDGSIIKAKEITTELDIDNDWIKSKKLFKA